ncbi:MAG: glutamine synthetase [Candidatus Manganitrophaceae bacterium]|nr:MAG: glutamine synthetase [Candidatus Manganitrophaceae bacterium]
MGSKVPGMLTQEELARRVGAGEIDTVLLVFTDHYGRFMGKRLDADFFLEDAAKKGTHACDYLLTVDMEMEPVPGYRFANWEKGYGDFHLVPDFATLRVASWLEKTALILCDLEDEKNHRPVAQAPRSMLRKQIDRAVKIGYRAVAASELEYYIFKNSYRDAAAKGYNGLEPAGWYLEDYHALQGAREEGFNGAARRHLKQSGIPVENSKGEWGLGQHELNVRYADILAMADRHAIFKQCLKEVAEQQQLSVTFMAKVAADQAGSSCHIHLSLWQKNQSAFPGKQRLGPVACSETFRWFLGGWIAHVSEMMVFYAPTVNSYKRYQAGSWAPTRLAWSYDNRTAGFRVVGEGNSLRIECRIPGADCNPYLAFAAALASGLDGIENKIEPPPIFEGDVYAAQHLPRVPRTLRDATDLFEKSGFAKRALGEEVVEHYLHFYRTEQESYDKAVTDWERRRYFERI